MLNEPIDQSPAATVDQADGRGGISEVRRLLELATHKLQRLECPAFANDKLLDTRLRDLELSGRSRNALRRMSLHKVRDLIKVSEDDLFAAQNLGERSVAEIRDAVESMGLHLAPPAPRHF